MENNIGEISLICEESAPTDCVNYCSIDYKQTWFSKAPVHKGFTK